MAKQKKNPSKGAVSAASVKGKMNPGQSKKLAEDPFIQGTTNQQYKKD